MCRHLFLCIFLIVLFGVLCDGQVVQFGACAVVKTMPFFNLEAFLGQWYEIERFPNWYEQFGECAFKRFQYCGRRVEIEHVYVRDDIQYVLHLNTTYVPGDEAVLNIRENTIDPVGIPLAVISTDYTNYALVYGCKYRESLGLKYTTAWILSRNPTLDEDILNKAHLELNSIPYTSPGFLQKVDQSEVKCQSHWTAHIQAVYLNEDEQK